MENTIKITSNKKVEIAMKPKKEDKTMENTANKKLYEILPNNDYTNLVIKEISTNPNQIEAMLKTYPKEDIYDINGVACITTAGKSKFYATGINDDVLAKARECITEYCQKNIKMYQKEIDQWQKQIETLNQYVTQPKNHLELAVYKVDSENSSDRDYWYGWGKVNSITDVWAFIGWLNNKFNNQITFNYLEHYNEIFYDFKYWLDKVRENNNVVARFTCGKDKFEMVLEERDR